MCGLFGVIKRSIDNKLEKAFINGMYFNAVRGDDSTGVAHIKNAFYPNLPLEVKLVKSLGGPTEFFEKHGLTLTRGPLPDIYMGHGRAATVGGIKVENAHPFEFDNIIGMHNGTVQKHTLNKFAGHNKFELDSQIILNEIDQFGIEETWKKLDGAACLIWFDKRDRSINFIRNKERPLHFLYPKSGDYLVFSSESLIAEMAMKRMEVEFDNSVQLKENVHVKIAWDDKEKTLKTENSEVSPFVRPTFFQAGKTSTYYGPKTHYGSYSDDFWDDDGYFNRPNAHQSQQKTVEKVEKTNEKTEKVSKNSNLIITEVVCDDPDNLTGHIYCDALTADGKRALVSFKSVRSKQGHGVELREILTAIENSEITDNAYFAKKLIANTVGNEDYDYVVDWKDLYKIPRRPKERIVVKKDNSGWYYEYVRKEETSEEIEKRLDTETAPWFGHNQRLDKSAYEHRVKGGCCNCSSVPDWEDKDELVWFDQSTFVCPDCQNLDWIIDLIADKEGKK